ncbi:MAG: NAD(+)/NADH kinase [Oscillospiraceae bacterium]|nr:NAD(+)/NADH kinase [Oscillospiraceae bacterium]
MPGHILLCPNPGKDVGFKYTQKAAQMLSEHGFEIKICPMTDLPLEKDVPEHVEITPVEEALVGASLIAVFGGDGTLLRTARAAMGRGIPIIGVNLGTMGMMAELEAGDLHKLIDAAYSRYTPVNRMMLDVELKRDGAVVFSDFALNDAVVSGSVRLIRLTAYGDNKKIAEFSGDGIIIATPTGSTAYSLAAGGPLVEPHSESIILTPVCAHNPAARSFVLAPDREVTIRLGDIDGKQATLSADGIDAARLETGDTVVVRKSAHYTVTAEFGSGSFYETVYRKLGEKK